VPSRKTSLQQFVIDAATTSALGGIMACGLGFLMSSIATNINHHNVRNGNCGFLHLDRRDGSLPPSLWRSALYLVIFTGKKSRTAQSDRRAAI
jgi:hypothetical protein